jgi:phage-related protein
MEFVPKLEAGWALIQLAADALVQFYENEVVPFFEEIWPKIVGIFESAAELIGIIIDDVVTVAINLWNMFGETIITIVTVAWDIITGVISGALDIIWGIIDVIIGIITLDWDTFWEGIKSIVSGAWTIIQTVVSGAWTLLKGAFTLGVSIITGAWDTFWDGLKGAASTAWTTFTGWFSGIWETFKTTWSTGWENLKEAVGNIFSGLKDILKAPFNGVLGFIEDMINAGIKGLNKLVDAANKIPFVNISHISEIKLPRLALGGDVIRSGLSIVGEAGPEIVKLGKGAQVAPLGSISGGGDPFGGAGIQIGQVVFQGTPTQMLEDWKLHSKLALRGL